MLVLGCSERPPPPTAPFVAGSEEDAVARVRSFLDAYVASDVERALSHLCERDPRTRAFLERSLAPGSPFRVTRYEISGAAPLWERKKPLYLVLVKLPRRSGDPIEHGYRVRAEDGCIERLFGGAPLEGSASPPHPPPPPVSEPGAAGADLDDEGAPDDPAPAPWGPPLPSAPVAPDDEIIDL